jgi:fatty acid desaturase
VNGFEHAMDVLANDGENVTQQSSRHVANRVSALQQRRLQFFSAAVRSAAVLAAAAVIFGGWMWLLFGFALILTGTYAAVLRHAKRQRDYAELVVRELGARRDGYRRPDVAKRAAAAESRTVKLRSYRAQ